MMEMGGYIQHFFYYFYDSSHVTPFYDGRLFAAFTNVAIQDIYKDFCL